MTAPALARSDPPRTRTVELILAHAHLRLGALALARVELETMAGLGLLDTPGLVDLAEVRWRTGDLMGAGEAANAALRDDESLPVALVIAAEAAAALGRPTEARRLASRALADHPGSIDAIFAGMPRTGVWPADAAEPPPTAPTLFDREPEYPGRVDTGEPPGHDRQAADRIRAASVAAPVALGFWDGEEGLEQASVALPDPAKELEAGRAALVAGALDEAAFRFGLALRLAPALAPAVLEATAGARGAILTMVRGDAYRLAGHETEARQAYAIAAQGGLPERRSRPRRAGAADEVVADGASPVGQEEPAPDAEPREADESVAAAQPEVAEPDPGEPETAEPEAGAADEGAQPEPAHPDDTAEPVTAAIATHGDDGPPAGTADEPIA